VTFRHLIFEVGSGGELLTFRYKGIDTDGKYKRGVVEAVDKIDGIRKVKDEGVAVIINIVEQPRNDIIRTVIDALNKQLGQLENRLIKSRKEKRQSRLQKIKSKKERLLRGQNRINSIKNRVSGGIVSLLGKQVVVSKDTFDKLMNLSKLDIRASNKSGDDGIGTRGVEVGTSGGIAFVDGTRHLEDREVSMEFMDKPKLRSEVALKKEKKQEKEINWELIEGLDDNKLKGINRRLRVKDKDILIFTKRLQIMISSGLTLIQSLEILKDTKNKDMEAIIENVLNNIRSGNTFSKSLSMFPSQFDYTYVSLVYIGETSGALPKVLLDIIEDKEQKIKVNKKIRTMSIYPSIVGIILVIIMVIGVLVFIPRFEEMFGEQDIELPLITRVVFGVANFMPAILLGIVGLIILIKILRKISKGFNRFIIKYIDKSKLSIKVVKDVLITSYMYKFSFTISLMIKNGIRLQDALILTQKTINNVYIKNEIESINMLMTQGLEFSRAVKEQDYFDELITNIILTGEESGKLSESLEQIANYYRDEIDTNVERIMELVQPASIIIIALVVIPVVFAIYMPVLNISSGQLLDL